MLPWCRSGTFQVDPSELARGEAHLRLSDVADEKFARFGRGHVVDVAMEFDLEAEDAPKNKQPCGGTLGRHLVADIQVELKEPIW